MKKDTLTKISNAFKNYLDRNNIVLQWGGAVCPNHLAADPCGLLPVLWLQSRVIAEVLPMDLVACMWSGFDVVKQPISVAGVELVEIDETDKEFIFCPIAALSICIESANYVHRHHLDMMDVMQNKVTAIDMLEMPFLAGVTPEVLESIMISEKITRLISDSHVTEHKEPAHELRDQDDDLTPDQAQPGAADDGGPGEYGASSDRDAAASEPEHPA